MTAAVVRWAILSLVVVVVLGYPLQSGASSDSLNEHSDVASNAAYDMEGVAAAATTNFPALQQIPLSPNFLLERLVGKTQLAAGALESADDARLAGLLSRRYFTSITWFNIRRRSFLPTWTDEVSSSDLFFATATSPCTGKQVIDDESIKQQLARSLACMQAA
jgi:hypothetical protein